MAIYLYCPNCKNGSLLNSRKCRKCGEPFPREGKKYRVVVSVDRVRSTRVVENLTVARSVEATLKADMVRNVHGIRGKEKVPTLGEVWKRYIEWAMENKKSWRPDRWNYHKHIAPAFKDKALDKISAFDIEKFRIELGKRETKAGETYSAATIRHQLVLIKHLYNVARSWGLYSGANPFINVKMPRLDNQVTEFLEDDQVARLVEVLDDWPYRDAAAFVKLALFTGLRRGELFKLTWADVDIHRRLVTLRNPKGGKTTTIPISEDAARIIEGLEVSSEFLFPGKNGKQRTNFRKPWLRIREAAGLPEDFRFHGLRHHFASAMVSSGVALTAVKELLTHKDISMTQRYSHLAPSVVREAAEKSARILTQTKKADVIQIEK